MNHFSAIIAKFLMLLLRNVFTNCLLGLINQSNKNGSTLARRNQITVIIFHSIKRHTLDTEITLIYQAFLLY